MGPAGATGPAGPAGATGPAGPAGTFDTATVVVATAVGAVGEEFVGVDCPGTATALGGGFGANSDDTPLTDQIAITQGPLASNSTVTPAVDGDLPTGWFVVYQDVTSLNSGSVYAICAS